MQKYKSRSGSNKIIYSYTGEFDAWVPATMDRKVDLPVPLIPTRPILSVSSMPMVTSVRTGFDTYRFVTCSRFRIFISCFSGGRIVLSRPVFHSFYILSSQLHPTSVTVRTQISVKMSTIRSVTDTGSYRNIFRLQAPKGRTGGPLWQE